MDTVTQAQLLDKALEIMEPELVISKKQGKDFLASALAVVEEQIELGNKVNLFGFGIFTPSGVLAKPKRRGVKPQTGEEVTYPPKPAALKVKFGIGKRVRDSLPGTTTKAGKELLAIAKKKAEEAAARREKREAEVLKAERKAAREAKKAGTIPGVGGRK